MNHDMTAVYFIAEITRSGADGGCASYMERMMPIVESHGGVYLARTNQVLPFGGDWKPDRILVIRFPSHEALAACFNSPEYKAIRLLREENVRSRAIIVEGLPETAGN